MIFNSLGKLVKQHKSISESNNIKIDINHFSSGIYYIRVADKENNFGVMKIMKN